MENTNYFRDKRVVMASVLASMKKVNILFFVIISLFTFTVSSWAQAPEKMSYQSVLRNTTGQLFVNKTVGLKISILQGSAAGTVVFAETHTPTTNAYGLVSLHVGEGTWVEGSFAGIAWDNGPFYIKTETDPAGGTTYTITGTIQLLSVAYALHTKTAGTVSDEIDPRVPYGIQTGDMQYWNGTAWVIVAATTNEGAALQMIGSMPTWVGGIPSVTSPTGKIWMDRNLGASQVATSSTDAASYGHLYQWGRGTDGHQIRTPLSNTTATNATTAVPNGGNSWDGLFITEASSPYDWLTPQNDNLWQGVSGTNNPCPSGYRLPTEAELEAERTSWGSNNNAAGAFASPLKLPMAGYRGSSGGSLSYVGSFGFYWSSTVDGTNARSLNFYSSLAYMGSNDRAHGFSVRCLKDLPPTVTTTAISSVTSTTATSGGNVTSDGGATVTARGVCYATTSNPTTANSTTSDGTGTGSFTSSITGLTAETTYYVRAYATNSVGTSYGNQVSFTTEPLTVTNATTGKIWMDRNLGASQVATSSTDAASYGHLYQWGRGTDGHQIRTPLSNTTATNATTAVPNGGNSWDGLFITEASSPWDWLTPQNNSLWQGVSGTNNPCPSGFRLPTEAEWNAERASWGGQNSAGAFASPLKLPVAGRRNYSNGSLSSVGSTGFYWSSTVDGPAARNLSFGSSFAGMYSNLRADGFSVRCLKD